MFKIYYFIFCVKIYLVFKDIQVLFLKDCYFFREKINIRYVIFIYYIYYFIIIIGIVY